MELEMYWIQKENISKQELKSNIKIWKIRTFSSHTGLQQPFEEPAKSIKKNVEEKLKENYQVENYIKLH